MIKKTEFTEKDKAQINLAIRLNDENSHEVALHILLGLLKKYEENSTINGLIATTYRFLNDLKKSILYFQRTVDLNPLSELASLGLFHGLYDIGEYSSAFNEMSRFLDSNKPKNYKITLKELHEQLSEQTPEYQKILIESYFNKFIKSN